MIKSIVAASVTAFCLANPGLAATADIAQISGGGDVTQTVNYKGPTPNYFDPNTNLTSFNDQYPFWQQYQDVMFNVAGVWDQSQIPTTLTATNEAYYNVVSSGHIGGTWTFDTSLLAQNLTGFTSTDGTLLGTSALNSTITLTTPADGTETGASTHSSVIVGNNLVANPGDTPMDYAAISAEIPGGNTVVDPLTGIITDRSGIQLILVGDSNWFEDASGAVPDFSRVIAAYIDVTTRAYADATAKAAGNLLYEEEVFGAFSGTLTGQSFSTTPIPAAGGSGSGGGSGMSPVPVPAALPLLAVGLAGFGGLGALSRRRKRRDSKRAA